MNRLIPLATLLCVSTLHAATTFTGSPNSIFDAANWDSGLPDLANQGTINADAAWPSDNDMSGWDLLLTGGTLADASTSFSTNEIYGSSRFTIQGGTWSRGGVVRLHGGAEVTVSGGAATIGGIAAISAATGGGEDGGFTLNVSSGSFTSNNVINFNNQLNTSTITITGGTATMGYVTSDTRAIDESNTLFNVSGGTLDLYSLRMTNTDNNIVVTISSGSLMVGAGGYNPNSVDGITDMRHVNFPAGSTGSWTLAGADQAAFEALYADGTLLFAGDQSAPFASAFAVNGNTITPIPEPSAAVLSLLGSLLLFRRRA